MAGLTRLELATFRVTGERSNQLSYSPIIEWSFPFPLLRIQIDPSIHPSTPMATSDTSGRRQGYGGQAGLAKLILSS